MGRDGITEGKLGRHWGGKVVRRSKVIEEVEDALNHLISDNFRQDVRATRIGYG
jgi:hypothetical protein